MRNLDPKRRRWVRVRVAILAVLLTVFGGAVVRRAWQLQIVQGAELRQMAEEQYLRDIRLAPKRGTIFDRHGAELAVSVDADSVFANPRTIKRSGADPRAIAARLASVLPGLDAEALAPRLSGERYFVWVKRRITPQQAQQVSALEIDGIQITREARRYYPNRELASHLLGFANVDGVGIEGLELAYEERLRGSVSAVPAIRDRRGAVVFSEQLLDDRAAQGDDLTLTIDKTIQHIAEQELAMAVRTFEARAGSVVVMDPRTGEILAMANDPTFNPNDPGRAESWRRRNRAVTDRFEPGSTVKPFTVAGALAMGSVGAEQLIDCGDGAMQVAEYTIHDSHRWQQLTPAQILAHSSNIGTARIGSTMGRAGLFRAFRRFGFGEETGLGLPGETSGILRHYRRWYEMDAATISFGQGMSVTTVQLAVAMSALANGGRLMQPVLVKRITDARGEVVEEALPRVRRQVVPEATARLVGDMLTAVTGPGGTGLDAAIDGYLVAGKTGTAQKADYVAGGYAEDQWVASFVGFVPADEPRLVIAVVIDEPVIAHYGGTVAGPVFRRIGEQALRHLGVPATTGGEALVAHQRARREREIAEARARREARDAERAARREARRLGLPWPPPSAEPPIVAAEEAPAIVATREPAEGEARVPDVSGTPARLALIALREAALRGELNGTGVVALQDPAPGSIVRRGTIVRVTLAPPEYPEPPEEIEAEVVPPSGVRASGERAPAIPPREGPVAVAQVPRSRGEP